MNLVRTLLLVLSAIASAGSASASWLDSDFYCRVYGCVVVHDGYTFDVYDNYIFSTGGTVSEGGKMIPWTGNPFQGAGGVNPVITGTRTEGLTVVPLEDQGVILGIDTNGDGIADRLPIDANNSGFLDAGDSLDPFNLTMTTDLVASTTSAQRSFYLSSRTDFYLTAESFVTSGGSSFHNAIDLSAVGFAYDITLTGNDDGMSFGSDAHRGNNYRPIGNIDDLGDVFGSPIQIMEFRRDIRQRDSDELGDQSIRFDYVYEFSDYDLSIGDGDLSYEIEFDFYNR